MFKFKILSIALHFLIFISSSWHCSSDNATDYTALTSFKSHLVLEPHNIISINWTSNTHFCNWFGISCTNQRVTKINLSGLSLQGKLSPSIANITQLLELDLSNNNLEDSLPNELGFLKNLRIFNVSGNSFRGPIPSNLSNCQRIQELDLSYNFIAGSIPEDLGLLYNLHHLVLDHNNLTGNIPSSFGNFSKLEYFYLLENDLEGGIPEDLGNLARLIVLGLRGNFNLTGSIPPPIFNISTLQMVDLSINNLSGELPETLGLRMPNLERLFLDSNRISGTIPISFSNASRLEYLFLTQNDFHGNIPDVFGNLPNLIWFEFEYNRISGGIPYGLFNSTSLQILKARHNYLNGELPHDLGNRLPNLQEIFLSHNLFSGKIPSSICNATSLVYLEVSNNSFSGPIPMMLGNLVGLEHLNLQNNLLTSNSQSRYLDFLKSLVNCRKLQFLILESNPLNGIIPESIGNLSSDLTVFTAISCEIKGSIPHGLGNLSRLNFLGLSNNDLRGEVPFSFRGLQNLERIYLTGNKLGGSVPSVLCMIKILGILHLGENMFSGSIPSCIGNLTDLTELSLAANSLKSSIPSEFWGLVKIQGLNLSRNLLHGTIPLEVGNLRGVIILDLSFNDFSGEVPVAIGTLQGLLNLDLSHNRFQGSIPNTLSNLIVIESLDLSSNNLSGTIPASLGSLRDLQYLNLSFNRLQGEIPHTGIFTNITYQYLMGNPRLCGGLNLNYPLCPPPQASRRRKRRQSLVLKITIPIAASFVLIMITFLLIWIILSRKRTKKLDIGSDSPHMGHPVITYQELVQSTESFNDSNVVGRGSSGTVYKANLPGGIVAAIKVLDMQYARALKNFEAECEALSKVRHRNLVKIISTCSNVDFKALVLEFMPNGSLDRWLHSESHSLSLTERLDIVLDVAMAMEYLHHDYTVPIVHSDLKPTNVLLDEDMTAHVADFGIAKFLAQDQELVQTKTLGTIGYIAPEYGIDGIVSTKGDVYSFGILLLETCTGKRPTDEIFTEGMSLHQWVDASFPDGLADVLDPNLFHDDDDFDKEYSSAAIINKKSDEIEELAAPIIRVALLCLKDLPEERTEMREVVAQLKKIRSGLKMSFRK